MFLFVACLAVSTTLLSFIPRATRTVPYCSIADGDVERQLALIRSALPPSRYILY